MDCVISYRQTCIVVKKMDKNLEVYEECDQAYIAWIHRVMMYTLAYESFKDAKNLLKLLFYHHKLLRTSFRPGSYVGMPVRIWKFISLWQNSTWKDQHTTNVKNLLNITYISIKHINHGHLVTTATLILTKFFPLKTISAIRICSLDGSKENNKTYLGLQQDIINARNRGIKKNYCSSLFLGYYLNVLFRSFIG